MMLVLNIVPHHHHDDAVCMVMESCQEDHSAGDEHAGHCHSGHGAAHGGSCVIESDYIITQTEGTRCAVSSCGHPDHVHLFPMLYIVADVLLSPAETISSKPEYGEYLSFYTSAEASRFHGLRAPPFILS